MFGFPGEFFRILETDMRTEHSESKMDLLAKYLRCLELVKPLSSSKWKIVSGVLDSPPGNVDRTFASHLCS